MNKPLYFARLLTVPCAFARMKILEIPTLKKRYVSFGQQGLLCISYTNIIFLLMNMLVIEVLNESVILLISSVKGVYFHIFKGQKLHSFVKDLNFLS